MKQHILKAIPEGRVAEIELLLLCARWKPGTGMIERICSMVSKDMDWDYFVASASRHRVLPLVYRSLEDACPREIPGYVLNRLKGHFRANAVHNLSFAGKLLKLLKVLENEGITAVPFKGPVLAEYIYGDLALRQFTDLDILVHKHDAVNAWNCLTSIGYEPEIRIKDGKYNAFVKANKGIPFTSRNGGVPVDLHWDVCGGYTLCALGLDFFDDRLETATLAGKKVPHFAPEDLLFYLCLHGTMESWGMLDRICCVGHLILSRPDLNWERVTSLSRVMRCERILFLGLSLAHDLLGIRLPESIMERLQKDLRIQELSMGLYKGIFRENRESQKELISRKFSYFHIEVREKFSEKIRYGFHLAKSPTVEEWRLLPLPAFLYSLYYVYRPIRLAVGLGLVMMRRYLIKAKSAWDTPVK